MFKLSPKYRDFLRYEGATMEILEGTTASGKTTTGVVKFLLTVAKSPQRLHVIAGRNLGVVEKNIINAELGVLDIFGDYAEYNAHGRGTNTLSHIIYHSPAGDKIIYILGYDNSSTWKAALGGQYGCIYIDEINTANMAFVRQAAMRCDYLMGTLNPDDPDKPIYKEYINRCRPVAKYATDAPAELLRMLDEPAQPGWVWWYFSFEHNAGLSAEKQQQIKNSHTPGTADYKHYILGLRGKAEGVIFDNFSIRTHTVRRADAAAMVIPDGPHKRKDEEFVIYSAGLDTAYSKQSDDTVAMSFIGITNKGRCFVLDENVLNNKDAAVSFAPSDIARAFVDFLERNRKAYGFARDVFIDSADQATITELQKLKRQTGSIYNFTPAHKQLKIIDRIQLQKGWIATGCFYVVDTCDNYIKELQCYAWAEGTAKTVPEDANDHMINSVQYAWIPFKNKIGGKV